MSGMCCRRFRHSVRFFWRLLRDGLKRVSLEYWGACAVVGFHTLDSVTVISTMAAVGSVLAYHYLQPDLAFNINWTLVSFSTITPLTLSIQLAFRRREQALTALLAIQGWTCEIYSAHLHWDWTPPKNAPASTTKPSSETATTAAPATTTNSNPPPFPPPPPLSKARSANSLPELASSSSSVSPTTATETVVIDDKKDEISESNNNHHLFFPNIKHDIPPNVSSPFSFYPPEFTAGPLSPGTAAAVSLDPGNRAPNLCGGRLLLPPLHAVRVLTLLCTLIDSIGSYLLSEGAGRGYHMFTGPGRRRAAKSKIKRQDVVERVGVYIARLHRATETLKKTGLPGNEAARLNQYIAYVRKSWTEVQAVKEYRTPTALRSFARVFVLIINLLFGPYYLWIMTKGGTVVPGTANMVYACVLAGCVSLFMSVLLEVGLSLEDPFRLGIWTNIDGIRSQEWLNEAKLALRTLQNDSVICHDWASVLPEHRAPDPINSYTI